MEFHEKLRSLRKANALSQEDLADQLGVSRQAVSKWESKQGYPETEKLLQIGTLFGVSLDYLLKESQEEALMAEEPGYYANREAVEGFLQSKRQGALGIGLGVAVLILSLCFVLLLEEDRGTILFLLGAAVGVAILVAQAFRVKRYTELESQPLLFDPTFLRTFQAAHAVRRKRYGLMIVLGIVLILLSFALSLLFEGETEAGQLRARACLPPFWAVAVFLFINAASALHAEGIIANNATHQKELAEENRNG